MNQTTATEPVVGEWPSTSVDVVSDIKSIVAEIAGVGWTENDALRVGITDIAGSGDVRFQDYPDANAGRLNVDYTEGGANPNQTQAIIMGWLRPFLLQHPFLMIGAIGLNKLIKRRQKLMK